MALRSEELPGRLQSLSGLLTSHEAARYLQLTYWHLMHLVEAGRIPGLRVVDRWLFSPDDLDAYRRSRNGNLEDAARTALDNPAVSLTEKQAAICLAVVSGKRPSEIARELHQSRQAVHAQLGLIREKVTHAEATSPAQTSSTHVAAHASSPTKTLPARRTPA